MSTGAEPMICEPGDPAAALVNCSSNTSRASEVSKT